MSRRGRVGGLLAAAILALGAAGFFFILPGEVDRRLNALTFTPPYSPTPRALALHQRLFIADLHDDALLWSRDLLQRHAHGHADLPRLQEGRVGLQVFGVVTKVPRGSNYDRNDARSDSITVLAMAQRWPRRTWTSLLERALYQAEKLHAAAASSGGRLQVVRTRGDLQRVLDAGPGHVAALLGAEGLHALEGRIENVDRLFDAGFRMAGLVHFFDNDIGGSAHGEAKGGLTPLGREVVRRLEHQGIVIDLAHASSRVIEEVLAQATRPVVVSHTGVQGTCPGPRNLSDAQLRAIARNGGLVGIGFFPGAVCGNSVPAIVRAIRHAVNVAGVDHVALGSDFDGATRVVFDASGLPLLTEGLQEARFSEAEIEAILGGNVRRLLLAQLPP